jgi:hypothetical protein
MPSLGDRGAKTISQNADQDVDRSVSWGEVEVREAMNQTSKKEKIAEHLSQQDLRQSTVNIIKSMDEGADFEDMVTAMATSTQKERLQMRKWRKIAVVATISGIAFSAVLFGLMLVSEEVSKEVHVSDEGAIVDLDGKIVQTKVVTTYVPLAELPQQSIAFLDKMDHVTYSIGKSIKKRSVSGYDWHNSSSLLLFLQPEGEMVIRNGIAFVRDRKHGRTDFIVQKRVSRRLQGGSSTSLATKGKGAYTWEELVNRYNTEISEPGVEGDWRRLAPLDTSGLSTMVAWFGALYESEIAVKEAENQATAALAATPCDSMSTEDVQAPQVGTTGRMVLTLQQEFNMEETMGDIQLLYLDFADESSTKFKLVQRPTLSTKNLSAGGWPPYMVVTEMVGGSMYNYEFYHPQSEIQQYYHQSHPALEKALDDPTDTNGLKAAKVVLESASFNAYKDTCAPNTGNTPTSDVDGSDAVLDARNPIDCNRGRFRWNMGGWILETTVDGQIVGLEAGEGAQHFEVIEVSYPAHHIDFSGCKPEDFNKSSRRLSPDDAPQKHRSRVRRLTSFQQFQACLSSDTKWCDAGTDILNTECPTTTGAGDYDYDADKACRRHDHGSKSNGIIGGMAVRLGCDIDHDLAEGTSKWCVQAIWGSGGLAQLWGCYDHGSYDCWNWASKWWGGYWRYGRYCYGEHTHDGPSRYSSYSHSYGYKAKAKTCVGDLW